MATPLNDFFVRDSSRLMGRIYQIMRAKGRVSALMRKEELPDGMGYNYITPVVKRSNATGGAGWQALSATDGTVNNCVPNPSLVNSATTTLNYGPEQIAIHSEKICFLDARMAYMFQEQVAAKRENFAGVIVDTWEDRDKKAFFDNAGHKIVFDGSMTESTGATMPAVAPTSKITQDLLDYLWQRIIQDGGGEEPYAMSNGAALIPAVMSIDAHRTLIKGSADIRQDFRYAEMGKGVEGATLLKAWGVDKPYGGFLHTIDVRMPRFNFVNGAWVEVPYYISQATTIGNEAIVNPAYMNAEYEDMYLWHPDVVHRLVPKPRGTVGADTRGRAVNYNGEVMWLNIPDEIENPYEDTGFWAARMVAAYKPAKVQYGYVVRFKRCPNVATEPCPAYG